MSHSYRKKPQTRRRIAMLTKRAHHDRQTNYRRDWQVLNRLDRERIIRDDGRLDMAEVAEIWERSQ